jgi:hypothetical protein
MFKKGDVVECTKDYVDEGQFTEGTKYVVSSYSPGPYATLSVEMDNNGEKNSWDAQYFKLVTDQKENKMSTKLQVHYLLTKGSITLHYSGLTKVIAKDDARFEKVLTAIRAGKMEEVPEIVDPALQFKKAGIEVEDGLLKVNGMTMPPELNARIMAYKSQKIPFQSLLNFWKNLEQNPSFNSRQNLFKFLENEGHSITEDGHFIGYRGVREDFKDKHSGKFDNSPGQVCEMHRSLVDDNPDNDCSHGLHVGGFKYAKAFGPKLVIVKVNPRDVVAVPNAYGGEKMRVCRFEVLSETQAALQETVVSTKGTKVEAFAEDEGDLGALSQERPSTVATLTRYANNHAKRGPDGKFIAKRK